MMNLVNELPSHGVELPGLIYGALSISEWVWGNGTA